MEFFTAEEPEVEALQQQAFKHTFPGYLLALEIQTTQACAIICGRVLSYAGIVSRVLSERGSSYRLYPKGNRNRT